MVGFSRSPFFKLRKDGTISVNLPSEIRQLLTHLADELGQAIETDHKDLRRLFPTAYPDDAAKDAGYQIFSRNELIDARHTRIETLRATAQASSVTEDQLSAWMNVVNDLRLLLGTKLDISEETSVSTFDPTEYDDPEGALRDIALYEALGDLLSHIIDALMGTLETE